MKIKVCGLTFAEQLLALNLPQFSHLGLIYHPASPRFAGNLNIPDAVWATKLTGVFVHARFDEILSVARSKNLKSIQLHGEQDPATCFKLKQSGMEVIKVFHPEDSGFDLTKAFENCCDYFLFDSGSSGTGGRGRLFDWAMLDAYKGNVPFFLSGGIAFDDAERLLSIRHPRLVGLDLNSRFELRPGIKNIPLLYSFLKKLQQ